MEKDDEVKGSGNSYDFGSRLYDSRLGRWLSVDKAFFGYPNQSTYSFCINNPIKFIDANGEWVVDENGNIIYTTDKPNSYYVQAVYDVVRDGNGNVVSYKRLIVQADEVTILTNKGTPVKAYKVNSSFVTEQTVVVTKNAVGQNVEKVVNSVTLQGDFTTGYNCTGNAMANQKFIIPSNEITNQVIADEGLVQIDQSKAKAGDVGMYIDENGIVQHLEAYITNNTVNTKGGVEKGPKIDTPGDNAGFKVGSVTGGSVVKSYKVYTDLAADTKMRVNQGNTTNVGVEVSKTDFDRIQKAVKPSTLSKEQINTYKRERTIQAKSKTN
jgi:RHS repeat-associated protein